jgi:hypothetical protein
MRCRDRESSWSRIGSPRCERSCAGNNSPHRTSAQRRSTCATLVRDTTSIRHQASDVRRSFSFAVATRSASGARVIRATPGYEISVPSFSGRDGSRVLTPKVTGSESIDGHGDAWRVDAEIAGLEVTFWISKTSRRLVRQVMHVAPGTEIVFVAPALGPSA